MDGEVNVTSGSVAQAVVHDTLIEPIITPNVDPHKTELSTLPPVLRHTATDMDAEVGVTSGHGTQAVVHDKCIGPVSSVNGDVNTPELDIVALFGSPDEEMTQVVIAPAAELNVPVIMAEGDGMAIAMNNILATNALTPATALTQLSEAVTVPVSGIMDDANPSAETGQDDYAGDVIPEDLPTMEMDGVVSHVAEAAAENDFDPYDSEPGNFEAADQAEKQTQISLTAQLAQQRREERRKKNVTRGALDPGSDSDGSSEDEEEEEESDEDVDDAMDGPMDGREVDISDDDELPTSRDPAQCDPGSPSAGLDPDKDELIPDESEQAATSMRNPSQMGQPMDSDHDDDHHEGGADSVGVEQLPDVRIRPLRHSSEELSQDEDEDDLFFCSDFSEDGDDDAPHGSEQDQQQPALKVPELPPKSAEEGLFVEQDERDPSAPKRSGCGYIPTHELSRKEAVLRAERGTLRLPEVEEAVSMQDEFDDLFGSADFQNQEPSTPEEAPAVSMGAFPMPSVSLQMPTIGLQMPSLGPLSSTEGQAVGEADGDGPLNATELAQRAMFSAITASKRAGKPLFGAPQSTSASVGAVPEAGQASPISDPAAASAGGGDDVDIVLSDTTGMGEGREEAEKEVDQLKDLKNKLKALNAKAGRKRLRMSDRMEIHREIDKLKVQRKRMMRGRDLNAEEGQDDDQLANEDEDETEDEDAGEEGQLTTNERVQAANEKAEQLVQEEKAQRVLAKRRKHAVKVATQDEQDAIQDEREEPTPIVASSRKRARTAKEYRLRDPEKQAEREHRVFLNEGKPVKRRKVTIETPEDGQKRKKLFKNRLASEFNDTDNIMAEILKHLNPTADAIRQRLEQGDIPGVAEIKASTKKQQLADLMLSIPLDVDERTKRCTDAQLKELNRASKSFGFGRVKATNGRWLMKGMLTPLYHHQLDGADWMVGRELAQKAPLGGILADSMGLGKTVTTLATIVGNPPDQKEQKKGRKATLIVLPASLLGQWEAEIEKHVEQKALSKVQIYKKSSRLKLRVLEDCDVVLTTYSEVLTSGNVKMSKADIETADKIGQDEWKRTHDDEYGVLHQIEWYRIVLDEAHAIKNWKSSTAQACFTLKSRYRWCLTGTPMLNSLDELYPYFKFFRLEWTKNFKEFKKGFGDPNAIDATKRLSVMMRMVMKRRTFGDQMMGRALIDLPIPKSTRKFLQLTKEEVVIYRMVEDKFRERINAQLRQTGGSGPGNYAYILAQLLRARQAAAHPFLLEGVIKELFSASDLKFLKAKFLRLGRSKLPIYDQIKEWIVPAGQKNTALTFGTSSFGHTFEMGVFLKTVDQRSALERNPCVKCHDMATDPQVANCHHIFCQDCIEGAATQANPAALYECPQCNSLISDWEPYVTARTQKATDAKVKRKNKKDVKWKPPVKSEWLDMCERNPKLLLPSSKTIAVKAQVVKWLNEAPEDKILIFTQFRAMARIIGLMCEREKIEHVYFTGDMTQQQREDSVTRFHTDKNIKVMIAILKCGGVGLNLSVANRVISIDPWWNHSVEQQAFARVFRLGQTKPTHFVRLFAKNTVDYRILDLQADKIKQIDAAMLSGKMSNAPPLTFEEIAGLFGQLVEEDEADGKKVLQIRRDYDEEDEDDGEGEAPSAQTTDESAQAAPTSTLAGIESASGDVESMPGGLEGAPAGADQ